MQMLSFSVQKKAGSLRLKLSPNLMNTWKVIYTFFGGYNWKWQVKQNSYSILYEDDELCRHAQTNVRSSWNKWFLTLSSTHTHTQKMANNIRFNRLKLHRLTKFFMCFSFIFVFHFVHSFFRWSFELILIRVVDWVFIEQIFGFALETFKPVQFFGIWKWWGRILWFPNHSHWILMIVMTKDQFCVCFYASPNYIWG